MTKTRKRDEVLKEITVGDKIGAMIVLDVLSAIGTVGAVLSSSSVQKLSAMPLIACVTLVLVILFLKCFIATKGNEQENKAPQENSDPKLPEDC